MTTTIRIEVGRAYKVKVADGLNPVKSSAKLWYITSKGQDVFYKSLNVADEEILGPYLNIVNIRIETVGDVSIDPVGVDFDLPSRLSSINSPAPNGLLYPKDFGCKFEYESRSQGIWDGTYFSDTYFKFDKKHIGWSFWQDSNLRTIVGVTDDGKAKISPDGYGSTDINWRAAGQDDTPYMQACLDAASPDYDPSNPANTFPETVIGLNGVIKYGKTIILDHTKTICVSNTQAQWNSGKTSCLIMRRRCSITSMAGGCHGATFVLRPGSYGDVLSNKDITTFTDFAMMSNFTINGDKDFNSQGRDGLHWETPYGNGDKVDPYSQFRNIRIERTKRHGSYWHGKGEIKIREVDAFNCGEYGMFLTGQYDVSVIGGQFGGCSKTGLRIDSPGPAQVCGVKSFFNGSGGGTNDEDSAGIVFECTTGDIFVGNAYITQVQTQETRGSGIVISIRNCQIVGCQFLDPNRTGVGSGTRPSNIAGIHLKGPYACNSYIQAYVGPTLTAYATPNWPVDTHVLRIDGDVPFNSDNGGPQNNTGYISYPVDTILPGGAVHKGVTVSGTGAILFGGGCTNGKNTGLLVNGVALT